MQFNTIEFSTQLVSLWHTFMMMKLPYKEGRWVVRHLKLPGIWSEAPGRYLSYAAFSVGPNPSAVHNQEFRTVMVHHFLHTLLTQIR